MYHNGVGSPPRTWGRLPAASAAPFAQRFTPTYVGQTCPMTARAGSSPVHPHVRGADDATNNKAVAGSGSPPRTWGRRNKPPSNPLVPRFTPTYVGQTHGKPRIWLHLGGSPPRTWGRRRHTGEHHHQRRFTPTYVGQTHTSDGVNHTEWTSNVCMISPVSGCRRADILSFSSHRRFPLSQNPTRPAGARNPRTRHRRQRAKKESRCPANPCHYRERRLV